MSKDYIKLDNFIRSYFNQDTVYELDSDDLGEIIDLYLSEVNQIGVQQLLIDISAFINDYENKSLNDYFEKKFSSYLNISPVEDFFSLLNSKYREKYPAVKSSVRPIHPMRRQHRQKISKRPHKRIYSHSFRFSPISFAASTEQTGNRLVKRNTNKIGDIQPYFVVAGLPKKSESSQRILLKEIKRKHQYLSKILRESIEATDIVLCNNHKN